MINFHLHSTGSDGHHSPEEVISEAIDAGYTYICFTDHYKFPPDFHPSDRFFSDAYAEQVKKLIESYKNKIDISFGAEFGWLDNHEAWYRQEIKRHNMDYALGSIHFVFVHEKPVFVDSNKENWIEAAKSMGGVRKLVEQYYGQMRVMVQQKVFDGVAHFDLIKIYNKDSELFSEDEKWYHEAVEETLDEIKKAAVCLEINPRGMRKPVGQPYPSLWILKEANKRGIPVTIGTDCHSNPDEKIDLNIEVAYDNARKAGYKSVLIFKNRKARSVEI